jgi:hypothetical protein
MYRSDSILFFCIHLEVPQHNTYIWQVRAVVTHVLLDVTLIICKDIARDVFKEKRGMLASAGS